MSSDIIVIDNFLEDDVFKPLQKMMLGREMPWFYGDKKVGEGFDGEGKFDFQFTHIFYASFSPNSQYFYTLNPLLDKINPDGIIKIKANMTTRTENIYKFAFHRDFNIKCFSAVYYINTNNGFTEFENGPCIESIENRMCIFDSKILHRGTTCTDEKVRCLINLNYIRDEGIYNV